MISKPQTIHRPACRFPASNLFQKQKKCSAKTGSKRKQKGRRVEGLSCNNFSQKIVFKSIGDFHLDKITRFGFSRLDENFAVYFRRLSVKAGGRADGKSATTGQMDIILLRWPFIKSPQGSADILPVFFQRNGLLNLHE